MMHPRDPLNAPKSHAIDVHPQARLFHFIGISRERIMLNKLTITGDTKMILLASAVAIFTNMCGATVRTLHDDKTSTHPSIMQRPSDRTIGL